MECLVEFDYKAEEEDELSLTKGDRITGVETKHDGWWEGTLNGKRGLFPDNFVKVITPNSGSGTAAEKLTTASTAATKIGEVGDAPKMRQKAGPGPHPRRLKAIFSYAPVQDDELQLDVGDVIHFMDEIEEGWWKGELKGRVGIFPSNFVAEVDKENNVNGNVVVGPDGKGEKETARNRDTFIAKNKVIPDIIPAYQTQSKDEETETAPKLPPKPGTDVRETAQCFYPYVASNDDELTIQEGDIVTIISKECEDEGWWRGELRGKIGVFPDNFVEIVNLNSPTTPLPAANQPKVTAQERTDDSKKEIRHPSTLPITTTGTSVVDGVGGSKGTGIKTETKVASQIKAFAKKESPTTKGPAPLSPISPVTNIFATGFTIKRESPQPHPAPSPTTEDVNLNSIERSSETLNHLTASRAKAPKTRPPSAFITREDEHEFGQMNGSGSSSLPMQAVKEADHAPPPYARTNSHTIHVPDGTLTSKETSPGPAPLQPTPVAVNKPKNAIPWMAELKLKQDTKKSTGLGSPTASTTPPPPSSIHNNNNISTVIVSPPAAASITTSSNPAPVQAKAPPLPVKPNIPTMPPVTQPLPIEKPAPSNKFGGGVVLKRNTSNPTPPTNHVHQDSSSSSGGGGEFVSLEEHNQLKERVSQLENELELIKMQLKASGHRGHIV